MTGKRRRYSAEFKARVALEALRGEPTIAQLVTKYGSTGRSPAPGSASRRHR